MKILHLVSSNSGGAGRAAIRISESINCSSNDIDVSTVLVGKKDSTNSSIRTVATSKLKKLRMLTNNSICNISLFRYRQNSLFSNSIIGLNIVDNELVKNCDVINLHWINAGMMSYKTLKKLQKMNKPIVWTMHDMWTFTGGCHYDQNCGKYKKKCGQCKVLSSSRKTDLSTVLQKRKRKLFNTMDVTIVGCSQWITECARESQILKGKDCVTIPNTININIYKPINKEIAKSILNIKTNKKIILFGAMTSTSDKRKGFKYLLEAVKYLDKSKYCAIIFGNDKKNEEIEKYLDVIYLGQLNDDYSLEVLYSCADVFVAPSKQENLANTVMESLACGTPVTAFRIGGMLDLIKHKENGYLADGFNSKDLAKGIEFCIENNGRLSESARNSVLSRYSYNLIGNKYLKLYKRILVERGKASD